MVDIVGILKTDIGNGIFPGGIEVDLGGILSVYESNTG
jgi:hypothetical protein